jgi:hypothetical protein
LDGGSNVIDAKLPARDGRAPSSPPGPSSNCVNLQCQQLACSGGATTSVSGTVYDPAGENPLYNVAVFVPNRQPEPFGAGATCDRCSDLYTGSPVAATLTDAEGRFKLENVPAGTNVPLVIQIGKWRRQVVIPSVSACGNTPLPAELTRLPRTQAEGDIPLTSIATGNVDTLECVLRKMGVADSEFTLPTGNGRIHMYRATGAAAAAPSGTRPRWSAT